MVGMGRGDHNRVNVRKPEGVCWISTPGRYVHVSSASFGRFRISINNSSYSEG
jgi:hypothetical protein